MVKPSLSREKKKAWAAFSKYIRQKYARNGYVTCYTCGKIDTWKKMQAGHGIPGRNNKILFDERIVRPQCVGCNYFGTGKYAIFTKKLIDELGMETYYDILAHSNDVVKMKVQDYVEIRRKYETDKS